MYFLTPLKNSKYISLILKKTIANIVEFFIMIAIMKISTKFDNCIILLLTL